MNVVIIRSILVLLFLYREERLSLSASVIPWAVNEMKAVLF
jgi:hypothetical protein